MDRQKIAEIVARDTGFIQASRDEELVAMAQREKVESQIKKAINERTQEEEGESNKRNMAI